MPARGGGTRLHRLLCLTALCLLPGRAGAQTEPQAFEASVVIGGGGFTRAAWAAGARRPSAAVHGVISYRVAVPIDLGIHVFNQWLAVTGLPEGVSASALAAAGGFIARFHPLALLGIARVDLSIGAGVDFFAYGRQTTQEADQPPQTVSSPGVALPVALGLDLFVNRIVALGAFVLWSPWWQTETCASSGAGAQACERAGSGADHYLFAGVTVRLHLRFAE